MDKKDIYTFFKILSENNPHPKSELEYTNTFTLLVAVVLSAQATDKGVNIATRKLFAIADSPEKMLSLGLEKLKKYIRTIGLYNTKAKNILALSEILIKQFDGKVPTTRTELMKLPGVGRKTANVVLNIAYQLPTIAVDTHIFRVCNRTGLAPGSSPEKVEDLLTKIVPKDFILHAHHWLILHGRYICKARKPKCPLCPVKKECGYKNKTE